MRKSFTCVTSQRCTMAYGTVELILGLLASSFVITLSMSTLLKINTETQLYKDFNFVIEYFSSSETIGSFLMICLVLGSIAYIGLAWHLIHGAFLRSLDNCRLWYRFNLALVIANIASFTWLLYQFEHDMNDLLFMIFWIAFRCFGLCIVRNFILDIETEVMFNKV